MVNESKTLYGIADWRRDNPVEADMMDLIHAARSFALSQVIFAGGESGDPEDPPERVDDTPTDLEMAIERSSKIIWGMLDTTDGRRKAGLKQKGRGNEYRPEDLSLEDQEVQIVLAMLRKEITAAAAKEQLSKIIRINIDPRTLRKFIQAIIVNWGSYADQSQPRLWVEKPES
jgi:hypothetical protein